MWQSPTRPVLTRLQRDADVKDGKKVKKEKKAKQLAQEEPVESPILGEKRKASEEPADDEADAKKAKKEKKKKKKEQKAEAAAADEGQTATIKLDKKSKKSVGREVRHHGYEILSCCTAAGGGED